MGKKEQKGSRNDDLLNRHAGALVQLIYTQDELNSLRYYKGAVDQIVLPAEKADLQDFYGVSNAYEVLNMLLYPGIDNEKARIIDEKRSIDYGMLDHMTEILKVYEDLASLIYKYTYSSQDSGLIRVRRFDREVSLHILEKGENCAFLSTTLAPDLDYFHKKNGLILEEIEAPAMVGHLDVNRVLGLQCTLAVEQEILFPPFLKLKLEAAELSAREQAYQDYSGKPPVGKYLIRISDADIDRGHAVGCENETDAWKAKILDGDQIRNAKTVLEQLSQGKLPDTLQEGMYTKWKQAVQIYVRQTFRKTKDKIRQEKSGLLRKATLFQEELKHALVTNNMYRKRYGRYVEATGIIMSVCSALVTFFLALSFVEQEPFAIIVKVIGLLLSCISLISSNICKSKVWEGKLKQRTYIYLKLDELQRDFRYEETLTAKTMEQYIQRFKEIISADNTYCEKNAESAIDHLDSLYDNQTSHEAP